MAGVQEYFEGFVFRGRPPGSDQPAEWHVEIGRYVDLDGVGRQMLPTLTLTPQQAEAVGHALPDILSGLDTAVMADRDAQATALAAMTAERDAIKADRDTLAAQIEAITAPAAPISVISDRQFFQALALAGDITEAEALAAVMTGTMPAKIEAAILELPADQQFGARMLLSGATTFDRHHPMVALLGQILDRDAAALNALWASAGTF